MSSHSEKKKESKRLGHHCEKKYHHEEQSKREAEGKYTIMTTSSSGSKGKGVSYGEGNEVVSSLSSLGLGATQSPTAGPGHNHGPSNEVSALDLV